MHPKYLEYKNINEVHIPDTCCNCIHECVCSIKTNINTPEKRELMAKICNQYKREV